jgi:predicted nucleic acid-binding protein
VTGPIALDTSVAVPLLLASHPLHGNIVEWRRKRPVSLCGHAMLETYSVLTRLPGDARLLPDDAHRLLAQFPGPLTLSARIQRQCARVFAAHDIAGGAAYDALVALAAVEHDAVLATRDARARATYEKVGATVEQVG